MIFYYTKRGLLSTSEKGWISLTELSENFGINKTGFVKSQTVRIKDPVFIAFFIILAVKSLLFICVVNSTNATSFSFIKGFFSYQAPPSLLVYSAFLMLFLSFSYLFQKNLRFWFLFFFDAALTLLIVGDLMFYRGFGSFLSPYVLTQTSNLDNTAGSIISMLRPIDALFFLDFVILLGTKKKRILSNLTSKRNILVFLVLFVVSISVIYYQHYRRDVRMLGEDMLFRVAWVNNQTMTNLSPVGYHLFDLYNYFQENQLHELKPDEVKDIRQWLAQKVEQLPSNEFKGIFKGKNLIVIQVESLENSVITQKIADQEITPNLNRLLQNSLYFTNLYEQVYNGNSSDADLIVNTSVYPIRNGATFFRFPHNTYNSLPELLELRGYTTLGIHPDKGSYWNWMQALNSIGFNKTLDASDFIQNEKIGLGLSDRSYLAQVASMLLKEREPFYSFMITLSSHSPFDLPEKYRTLDLKTPLNTSKLGGYFQSISYTDREIGNFLAELQENELLNNTVIVIYGDHTGVHKYYNDEIQNLQPGEDWWFDDSKRVPLIIYSKDITGQKIDVTGGQIDIMPTLAYLFDLDESYKETALGRNLLNTKLNFAVLANKDFIGTAVNDAEKLFLLKALDISDLIIRSDYYRKEGF